MKLELLNRALVAATLIALAVTLGVWLSRAPLAAAPATTPTPVKTAPEPTLTPPPAAPAVTPLPITPTVIEVPVEVEIATTAEPPAVESDGPRPESKPSCSPHRRGLFRRR
jgi:hypothetical protein